MFSFRLLGLLAVAAGFSCANAAVYPLTFRPVATEYSEQLDRLVMIAGSPNQLHIYNPANGTDAALALPSVPLSLSVSPDGLKAVVGHSSSLTLIDLSTTTIDKTLPISIVADDVTHTGSYVYVAGQKAVTISNGLETSFSNYSYGSSKGVYANGKVYYKTSGSSISSIAVPLPATPALVSETGYYSYCGSRAFAAKDGKIISCSVVFAPVANKLEYYSQLASGPSDASTSSFSHSSVLNRVAAIQSSSYSDPTYDNQIQIYGGDYYDYKGGITVPTFTAGSKAYIGHGRFVTFSADSSKLYSVVQADATSGLNNDFAIFTTNASSASCNISLAASSTSAASSSSTTSIPVTATDGCLWQATTSEYWISLKYGGYGVGSGVLGVSVSANTGPARSGQIQIGALTYYINQSANTSTNPAPLPAAPIVVKYSKKINKLVFTASSPNQLILFDPVSKTVQSVPLVRTPVNLSLSADGAKAAVTTEGFVQLVNLDTAVVEKTFLTGLSSAFPILPSNGYVYLFNSGESKYLDLSTGAKTAFNTNSSFALLHPSNRYVYTGYGKYSLDTADPKPLASGSSNYYLQGDDSFTEDGGRLITRSGSLYRSSEIPAQDLQPAGSLSGLNNLAVGAAAHSSARQSIAIGASAPYYYSTTSSEVRFYNDQDLAFQSSVTMPTFNVNGQVNNGLFKGLFWNSDSSKLFAILAPTPTYSSTPTTPPDSVLYTITPTGAIATCSYAVTGAPTAPPAGAASGTVSVNTTGSCLWQASSNAPWLRITSGSPATGTSQATFTIDANPLATPRTATLVVADKVYTVVQGGIPISQTLPAVASFGPLTGAGPGGTFTATFTHNGGASQHYLGYILFLPTPNIVWFTAKNSCLIEYNRISNGVRLINDAGDNWLGPISGVPISPTAGVLSNSFCTVNVAGTVGVVSGPTMTVTVPVTFKNPLTVVMGTFLQSEDVRGNWTGMTQFGNWVLPGGTTKPGASIVAVSPSTINGTYSNINLTTGHSGGVNQLSEVHMLIASSITSSDYCHVIYFPLTDKTSLVDDAGTALIDYQNNAISNSRCGLYSRAIASRSGNNLTLSFSVSFNPSTFSGARNLYLNSFDVTGGLSHWVQVGTVNVQ